MKCRYCQTWNEDDEPRCIRCGRRLSLSAPPESENFPIVSTSATAYAYAEERNTPLLPEALNQTELAPPRQPSLFPLRPPRNPGSGGGKVIPFAGRDTAAAVPQAQMLPAPSRPRRGLDRRPQQQFEFPAAQTRRSLDTSVEAAIHCGVPVAAARDRLLAGLLDLGFIGVALVFLVLPFGMLEVSGIGASLPAGQMRWVVLISGAILTALLYHTVWHIAGAATPGMYARRLRLLNFDGQAPTIDQRMLRLGAALLSIASAGVGLLWILFDEEGLAWHDHISKTFPSHR